MPYLDSYERSVFDGRTSKLFTYEEGARKASRCFEDLELATREKEYINSLSPNTEFARWIKYMFPRRKR